MKIKTFFLVYTIIVCNLLSMDNSLFDKLKSRTELNQDELLFVTYLNPMTCAKCYIGVEELIAFIEKNKGSKKVKYLALVKVDREIELKAFKRDSGWEYYLFADDGDFYKKLDAKESTVLSVLNSFGKNIFNLNSSKSGVNLKLLKQFLDKK